MTAINIKDGTPDLPPPTDINRANTLDDLDDLDRLLSQATAMVDLIHGEGAANFDAYCTQVKDDYLWAVVEKLRDAHSISKRLTARNVRVRDTQGEG